MKYRFVNPDSYHGRGKKSNFFEGWYFKLISPSTGAALALIPGIFFGEEGDSHCFIQVLSSMDSTYVYNQLPASCFEASTKQLDINIDQNHFSLRGISVEITHEELSLKGNIEFSNVISWPDSLLNPGSMGFYNYLSFMQCYSQVCAMSTDLKGSIEVNGETIDFTGGKGYIEKNWGKDFPYSWIWVQSNSFMNNAAAALSCSIAHIPFPISSFTGFLIGLYLNGELIKFTSINHSRLSIKKSGADVCIFTENRQYQMTITTFSKKGDFLLCRAPRDNSMKPLVNESLLSKASVNLKFKDGKEVFSDTAQFTGIEYGGDQYIILDSYK